MSTFIDVKNATFSVPVKVGSNRTIKTDLFNVIKQFYIPKASWHEAILLQDINLQINQGDRIALIGANGAGKTTLLYLLGGNYYPVRGEVHHSGNIQPIYNLSVGFNKTATGLENIYLRGLLMGMSLEEVGAQVEGIIEFSELRDHIQKPLSTYSSGMRMRLAFAITMCISPDVLIMDEWFNVGDKNFRKKAKKRLTEFVESSKALVIASHSESTIKSLCNQYIKLEHGEIVERGEVGKDFSIDI